MWWEYAALASCLHTKSQEKKVYYLPSHGNWGDGLIREGTIKFFNALGLPYCELHRRILRRNPSSSLKGSCTKRLLIYGGGGGWCDHYSASADIVSQLAPHFSEVVVLPSTYQHCPEIANVHWFARDDGPSLQVNPRAEFCHDMAFYLKPESRGAGSGTGWFMRTDRESLNRFPIPQDNIDLSLMGNYQKPGKVFFETLDAYAVIHTDRLHVAIAAALLGKSVFLYPGAYFKNQAVWQSSIQSRFPKVTLVTGHG